MLRVSFKRLSALAGIPRRMTSHASGYDLEAALEKELTLPVQGRCSVPTGLALALPPGFEAQIRPRSGLAAKHGIGILNSPGTIDCDYRGEIKVILFNAGDEPFVITPGMRIAQMVIQTVPETELVETDSLDETGRNAGGFGHTGY